MTLRTGENGERYRTAVRLCVRGTEFIAGGLLSSAIDESTRYLRIVPRTYGLDRTFVTFEEDWTKALLR